MKKYAIIQGIAITIILLLMSCPTQSGKSSGGGDSGIPGSLSVATTTVDGAATIDEEATTTTEGTGTVDEEATETITQSNGNTQSNTTSEDDPDTEENESEYIFEDVPEGEATVEITTEDGTTSQEVEVVAGETTEVNPFGSTQEIDNSLTAHVYEVDEIRNWWGTLNWSTSTDNINTDKPLGIEFYSKEINVPEREFSEGFPGIADIFEYFGVIYTGTIKPKVSGVYTFKITCDDGRCRNKN